MSKELWHEVGELKRRVAALETVLKAIETTKQQNLLHLKPKSANGVIA